MELIILFIVMLFFLWSITKTIEKSTDRLIARQEEQLLLIKDIKKSLEKTNLE